MIDSLVLKQILIVGARVGPALWLTPLWGGRSVPALLRVALIAAMAWTLSPNLSASIASLGDLPVSAVTLIYLKEAIVGFCLGWMLLMTFQAIESAGWLVDFSRGVTQLEVTVAHTGSRTSPLGLLGHLLAVVLFAAIGGVRSWLFALGESYRKLPIHQFVDYSDAASFVTLLIDVGASLFASVILLAAPVLIVMVLVDVVFGVLNRLTPNFSAYFVAMPLKSMLGLFIWYVALATLVAVIPQLLAGGMDRIEQALMIF